MIRLDTIDAGQVFLLPKHIQHLKDVDVPRGVNCLVTCETGTFHINSPLQKVAELVSKALYDKLGQPGFWCLEAKEGELNVVRKTFS